MKRLLLAAILCALSPVSSASWTLGGSDDYLVSSTTPITAMPFTMSYWFKNNAACDQDTVFLLSDSTADDNDAFGSRHQTDCAIAVRIKDSGTIAISTDTFSTSTWTNIIIVYTSTSDVKTYIDNGAGNGSDTSFNAPLASTNIRLGGRFLNGPNDYNGHLAQVALFDVAINSTTRADLQTCTPDTTAEGSDVVAYWPLDENNTNDAVGTYDLTSEGDALTFDGADDPSAVSVCGNTAFFRRRR